MMRQVFLTLFITAFVCVTLSARNEHKHSKQQQEVLDVDHAIQEAVLAGDVAALDRHWSKDAMFIGGDGRVWNKVERLKDFQSQNRKVAAQQLEQPSVRVYGDTAIVAYAGWQEGIRDGQAFKSRSYLTRVYLKRGGRWQLVHQQSTLIERASP